MLIVLDEDLLITSNDPTTGLDNMTVYSAYIESKLLPHVGGDFASAPTFIKFSGKYGDPQVLEDDAKKIQSILQNSDLSFVYMLTHGEDYFAFSDGQGAHRSVPFFEVGKYWFYSVKPTGDRQTTTTTVPYIVADYINPSYDSGDAPSPFVWMDTCCSAGSDGKGGVPTSFFSLNQSGVSPDNSWADAFSIDELNGGFLGWMGVVTSYGQPKCVARSPFNSTALGTFMDGPAFDRFRKTMWEDMFTNRMYINNFLDSALFDASNAGISSNSDYVGARERAYYFGNPFLNFPSP